MLQWTFSKKYANELNVHTLSVELPGHVQLQHVSLLDQRHGEKSKENLLTSRTTDPWKSILNRQSRRRSSSETWSNLSLSGASRPIPFACNEGRQRIYAMSPTESYRFQYPGTLCKHSSGVIFSLRSIGTQFQILFCRSEKKLNTTHSILRITLSVQNY